MHSFPTSLAPKYCGRQALKLLSIVSIFIALDQIATASLAIASDLPVAQPVTGQVTKLRAVTKQISLRFSERFPLRNSMGAEYVSNGDELGLVAATHVEIQEPGDGTRLRSMTIPGMQATLPSITSRVYFHSPQRDFCDGDIFDASLKDIRSRTQRFEEYDAVIAFLTSLDTTCQKYAKDIRDKRLLPRILVLHAMTLKDSCIQRYHYTCGSALELLGQIERNGIEKITPVLNDAERQIVIARTQILSLMRYDLMLFFEKEYVRKPVASRSAITAYSVDSALRAIFSYGRILEEFRVEIIRNRISVAAHQCASSPKDTIAPPCCRQLYLQCAFYSPQGPSRFCHQLNRECSDQLI